MSDYEDENYVTFGTALDPLDEDNLPRKKAVTITDQYAYDSEGRRRFHGAFTGGFSAGYFNSVGSQDGWRPQQFKSSRSSRIQAMSQRVEDFMDEEDTGEFGIAPKGIRATEDYAERYHRGTKRERVVDWSNSEPIPGTPVLKELLKPTSETVGVKLLKKMGWKPGQGIGSRITKRQKAKIIQKHKSMKIYKQSFDNSEESSPENSDDDSTNVTFAPDDYEPFRCQPKDNYFGIGYSGLDRKSVLSSNQNVFDNHGFKFQDKNKKLSIHGQAFGVGVFEADDDDIYEKEDLSCYDFTLEPVSEKKTRWSEDSVSSKSENICLEGFMHTKMLTHKEFGTLPNLPKDFVPVHTVRKSRFYPPIECPNITLEKNKHKHFNSTDRAKIIEDNVSSEAHTQQLFPHMAGLSQASEDVSSSTVELSKQSTDRKKRLDCQQKSMTPLWMEKLQEQSFVKGGLVCSRNIFDSLPQSDDIKKSYIDKLDDATSIIKNSNDALESQQDVESVRIEHTFAPDVQKQQNSTFQKSDNKFADIKQQTDSKDIDRTAKDHLRSTSTINAVNDVKQAAKRKLFGKLTRTKTNWKPSSIVCKRFNIPEPANNCSIPDRQKSVKFSIFDTAHCTVPLFIKSEISITKEVTDAGPTDSSYFEAETKSLHLGLSNPLTVPQEIFDNTTIKMRNFEASYEKIFGKDIQGQTNILKESKVFSDTAQTQDANFENIQLSMNTNINLKNKSEEKKDLFKAIFLSSSEDSESDTEEHADNEAVKSILVGKIPKDNPTLRNASPPRGIFAKLDLENLVSTKTSQENSTNVNLDCASEKIIKVVIDDKYSKNSNESLHKEDLTPEASGSSEMYGPKLPVCFMKMETSVDTAVDLEVFKPTFKSLVMPKKSNEILLGRWVEQSKLKKVKKEKKKHKEHRHSKHKRKSKKRKH